MLLLLMYFPKKFLQANSVYPDQKLRSVVSELGLHCLHMTPKRVSS